MLWQTSGVNNMTRHEFYEWLDTCPTHKWEITYDDSEFISVSFPIEETKEGEDDAL